MSPDRGALGRTWAASEVSTDSAMATRTAALSWGEGEEDTRMGSSVHPPRGTPYPPPVHCGCGCLLDAFYPLFRHGAVFHLWHCCLCFVGHPVNPSTLKDSLPPQPVLTGGPTMCHPEVGSKGTPCFFRVGIELAIGRGHKI